MRDRIVRGVVSISCAWLAGAACSSANRPAAPRRSPDGGAGSGGTAGAVQSGTGGKAGGSADIGAAGSIGAGVGGSGGSPADAAIPMDASLFDGGSKDGAPVDAGDMDGRLMDLWGIRELYPTKPGGEEWFMTTDPSTDPRSGVGEGPKPSFTRNDDGSWKIHGVPTNGDVEVRWAIATSTGYDESQIATLDQQQLARQGYMLRPNDWKNVEMTGYYRINAHEDSTVNGEAHLEDVVRAGRSTSNTSLVGGYPASCEATSYHSNVYPLTGRVKLEKDLQHTNGYTADNQDPQIQHATAPFIDSHQWVGIKTVVYNSKDDLAVRIEQWIDAAGTNEWTLAQSYVDDGHWGGGTPQCGGVPTTVVTWGGPLAVFRADHLTDLDVRQISVREIVPPQ